MNRPATTAAARPAQFDRASQHRRSMIAKIQIARQQLQMVEDDYRQILFDATGQTSLKTCGDAQLARVLDVMKSKGFQALPRKGNKGVAQHPVARKARALWISLYHLGVVHNPAEEALEAFAAQRTGCERMVWMRQSDGYKLIEALKDWGSRSGWRMSHIGTHKPYGPLELAGSLCHAIMWELKRAGAVPDAWSLHDAVWKLLGEENGREAAWTVEDYHRIAGGLGAVLRRAKGGAA